MGPCGWEAGACTLKESKGTKMPPKWCLCTGKGLVRGCGVGGMGAHRPCSSSRKLNEEKKRTPPPPPPTEPQMPNAFCKMLICGRPRPQRDGSPCVWPRTRHHRVFGSRSGDELAAPPSPATPAPAGEGAGTGIPHLPLTKESLQRPKTKNTSKWKKKKIKTKHCHHQLI